MRKFILSLVVLAFVSISCNLQIVRPIVTPAPTPTPTLPPSAGMPYDDASPILAGICFDYLLRIEGQIVILDSQADLNALYSRVDRADICAERVARKEFDFSAYQIVGTVVSGVGCTAQIVYDGTRKDEAARTQTIELRYVISDNCPYHLVRPVWLAVPRSEYTTTIQITRMQ